MTSCILRGYDIDGVLTANIKPIEPFVVISGRTLSEYNSFAKTAASIAPVYIRCIGAVGDRKEAANFKAMMINYLKVQEFYEDDQVQIDIIKQRCPNCKIWKVLADGSFANI